MANYFNEKTDEAVRNYIKLVPEDLKEIPQNEWLNEKNLPENEEEKKREIKKRRKIISQRNDIFVKEIKPALEKIVSYHYYRTPISKNPEIMQDAMVDLYQKIDGFNIEKYSRAFPYLNMICRNFFIQASKEEKKRVQNDEYSISLADYQKNKGKLDEHLVEDIDEQIESFEFLELFKENLDKWKDSFKKDQEKIVVDALITLFNNAENIELAHSKKAVFWYLREITGLNSKQIALNLKKIKKKFELLKKRYRRGDF